MHGTRETQKVQKGKNRGWVEGNAPLNDHRKGYQGSPRRYYETETEEDDDDSSEEEE